MNRGDEIHQVLVKARALIAEPKRWTKGGYAFDAKGSPVDPVDSQACRWCATGALLQANGISLSGLGAPLLGYQQIVDASHLSECISSFNDIPSTTHADVMALFDRAIEATKP